MVKARKELSKRVRKVFRQSGLSADGIGIKVMCSIRSLEPEGRVSVATNMRGLGGGPPAGRESGAGHGEADGEGSGQEGP